MAVTIDTSVSGESSNSYASLAEINTYMEAHPLFYATWAALTDAVKNTWLVYATRAIDRTFRYRGARYDCDQALEFPRSFTDDNTDEGAMPQKVKDAQAEMIIYLYKHISSDDLSPEQEISELAIGRGALSMKFKDKKPDYRSGGGYLDTVRSLLRTWILSDYNVELLRG